MGAYASKRNRILSDVDRLNHTIQIAFLRLVFFRRNEPLPTDRKSAARLSPVIQLKNEFIGDIDRRWQGNHWKARFRQDVEDCARPWALSSFPSTF
jgi:hypothetical protein